MPALGLDPRVACGPPEDIVKAPRTYTGKFLGPVLAKAGGAGATMLLQRKMTQLVHEGRYAAEVEIELHYSDESWSPTMPMQDAQKLEAVRLALRDGNLTEAAKLSRVFELTPIAAE